MLLSGTQQVPTRTQNIRKDAIDVKSCTEEIFKCLTACSSGRKKKKRKKNAGRVLAEEVYQAFSTFFSVTLFASASAFFNPVANKHTQERVQHLPRFFRSRGTTTLLVLPLSFILNVLPNQWMIRFSVTLVTLGAFVFKF
jgi:hypothetical protein